MALTLFATKPDGTPLANGGGIPCLSGTQIIIEELNQFSPSSAVIPAASPGAVDMMTGFTVVTAEQDGVGILGTFYVVNARQTIGQDNTSTITLDLRPLPVECTWERTGPGWKAVNALGIVAARIASLTPGWTGVYIHDSSAKDVTVSVPLNNPTVLAGFLETAKTYGQFARQGVDATGAPTRILEMGQFGAAPTVTITDPKGADVNEMATNAAVKPVVTVDRTPNDVTNLVNVVIPYGGGQDAQSLVTVERLWRILNDPRYPGYGRYGTDAESIARTGKVSLFPEYDPNYPISDPRNPPTFVTTYFSPPKNPTAEFPHGDTLQGALGTRGFGTDGRSLFYVYDNASYIANGHKMGEFIDSSLTYTDNSVANQELTAQTLYVSTITNFKRRAHGHHSFSFTAPGIGRPTRAGDLIAIDVQRVSVADTGAIVEMDVRDSLRVMSVTRAFGDSPPIDSYIVSNLGRFEDDDQTAAASQAATLISLQRQEGTGLAKDSVIYADNIDAANPMTVWHYISKGHFRYGQVRVRVDFMSFRGTAATAYSDPNIEIAFDVPHGNHNLDGTFNADGTGVTGTTDGFDLVQTGKENDATVRLHLEHTGLPNSQMVGNTVYSLPDGSGAAWAYKLVTGSPADAVTAVGAQVNFTKAKTKSGFTAPIKRAVSVLTNLAAKLPPHNHLIEKRIPVGQPSPASITMSIDGIALSSGKLATGTRDTSGAFTTSFIVDDIGPELDAFPPGTDVPIRFDAGTSASNPFGVGYVQITITAQEELGGLTSTVQIS